MKVKHNAILILVSSKWLIPYSGDSSKFLISIVHLIFFRSSKFPLYLIAKLHLNHCKVSPCVFNFSFLSCDHLFVTGVLHGGSTWWFVKDLIPSRSVLRDSFQRTSSFLHLASEAQFFLISSFEVVLCHSWLFEFMFHDSHVVKNEVF